MMAMADMDFPDPVPPLMMPHAFARKAIGIATVSPDRTSPNVACGPGSSVKSRSSVDERLPAASLCSRMIITKWRLVSCQIRLQNILASNWEPTGSLIVSDVDVGATLGNALQGEIHRAASEGSACVRE